MYPYLDLLHTPSDLASFSEEQLDGLCEDIRQFLIDKVSAHGGHLASNLGVVELTVALHLEFDTSRDRLVFDVGHQSYVHKLLTGRRSGFDTLRSFGGMAGFPKPSESIHDACIAGHASASVSVAAGMARARTALGDDYSVIALIGDGSLSGGLAYEALNDVGRSGEKLIVILNDNGMSIAQNVGALAQKLAKIRVKPSYSHAKNRVKRILSKIPGGERFTCRMHNFKQHIKNLILPGLFFEGMGFVYLGPVDGHNIDDIRKYLRYAKTQSGPTIVHIKTIKGKGYRFSQERPEDFHGISVFNATTGRSVKSAPAGFSQVFSSELCSLASADDRIFAITAAMPLGTGLTEFASRFPSRFLDVGIAEEHAVATAAGMAKQGLIPIVALYSTFLQRAYDQLIHDVSIDSLHVVFCIDRAGISGEDGETHQGIFDIAFLSSIPGMKIFCPASAAELRSALKRAVFSEKGPVAIRYPKSLPHGIDFDNSSADCTIIKSSPEPRITLFSYGAMLPNVLCAASMLEEEGIACEVAQIFTAAPLAYDDILHIARRSGCILIIEDCVETGSVGERICARCAAQGIYAQSMNTGAMFIPCGSIAQLQKMCSLDPEGIALRAKQMLDISASKQKT